MLVSVTSCDTVVKLVNDTVVSTGGSVVLSVVVRRPVVVIKSNVLVVS